VLHAGDVISPGVGKPDFSTPWRIRKAGIFSLEKGQTSYTSNLGLLEQRRSITKQNPTTTSCYTAAVIPHGKPVPPSPPILQL
jgi:aspartate/methionine/tyrosine aminotransferase